jgi:hypothetical protein
MRGGADGRGSNVEESPDSQKQRCRVTPGRGNPMESATEKKPPAFGPERVKRWGKSPPPVWQQTGHGKPHREQCQIGTACCASDGAAFAPAGPGWQLEGCWQQHPETNGHLGRGNPPMTESGLQPLRAMIAGPDLASKNRHPSAQVELRGGKIVRLRTQTRFTGVDSGCVAGTSGAHYEFPAGGPVMARKRCRRAHRWPSQPRSRSA